MLLSPSSGQARIDVADETDPFNHLTISLADDTTFTSAIFNIFGDSGTVDISVSYIMADGSPLVTSFDTSNGSNFFTIVGNGALLAGITLTTDGSFGDLRPIRIGGYAEKPPVVNVPDSGVSLMLVGLGFIGLAAFRRVRR